MILVKFNIDIGCDDSFKEYSYFENYKGTDYKKSYTDITLLEEVYGIPCDSFEEAEQSCDVYDYGDEKCISVYGVYELYQDQLETLKAFRILI